MGAWYRHWWNSMLANLKRHLLRQLRRDGFVALQTPFFASESANKNKIYFIINGNLPIFFNMGVSKNRETPQNGWFIINGTYLSSIFSLYPSKTRSFPIKTRISRVIWLPGTSLLMPNHCQTNLELHFANCNNIMFVGDLHVGYPIFIEKPSHSKGPTCLSKKGAIAARRRCTAASRLPWKRIVSGKTLKVLRSLRYPLLMCCWTIWMFPKIVGFPPKSSIKQ